MSAFRRLDACQTPAEANHRLLDLFLDDVAVLDLDRAAARAYGSLRAAMERSGTPIGANNMLIAAQALAVGAVFVSANLDELRRVDGLVVESWRWTSPPRRPAARNAGSAPSPAPLTPPMAGS